MLSDATPAQLAIELNEKMHGAVVLDENAKVLRPAILWNDGRSPAQCLELERLVPNSRQITGNLAMPGFTAPKLLWLREHEPAVFEQIRTVLLPKDWLRLQLSGEAVSEITGGARLCPCTAWALAPDVGDAQRCQRLWLGHATDRQPE